MAEDALPVLLERDGAVGRLTLNRPDRMNAWTVPFATELRRLLGECDEDPEVRAIVMTGAGRAFSAGADLKSDEHEPGDRSDIEGRLKNEYNPVIRLIRDVGTPVVAAVNGPAVGIGCSLALACDLIVAAESAYFGQAFVKIGLMPDGGSSAFLPPLIGKARATEMILTGDFVSAADALHWGMVNRVVPDDELLAAATELASRLAAGPPLAIAAAKRAINNTVYAGLDDQMTLEAEGQGRLSRTDDFAAGVEAFLGKRAPEFKGS